MQITYNGEHSIDIGDFINDKYDPTGFVNTWKDLHLIPTSRPVINPPKVQTNSIEIPGANGTVDLTDVLVGYPLYYNRTGSIEFYVDNSRSDYSWDVAYDTLLNFLHGFKRKVILTDSPSYYYEGRLSVNSWKSDKLCSIITIDYDLAPFKQMIFTTSEDWLWNPFDFESGIIINESMFRGELECDHSTPWVEFGNAVLGTMPFIPIISLWVTGRVSEEKTLEYGDPPSFTYTIDGTNKTSLSFFDADYITGNEVFRHWRFTEPRFTVGSPMLNYKFGYQFTNTVRDVNGDPLTGIYTMQFRPGRL